MSSPPTQPERGDPAVPNNDVDAEMEDAQDLSAGPTAPRAGQNEDPSATIGDDFNMQSGTQGTTGGGLAHPNRKDVSLREFLSKMDDYAPIVRFRPCADITAIKISPR
jgi:hypothetical protein